ncbi:putative carboxylesterase [Aspergillus cavernicola]|uniref:Carboxylesterase n=1 Tax=Aspergillus cavernicola TaxID=176166 RepID=A0ABR4J4Y1_9EURO
MLSLLIVAFLAVNALGLRSTGGFSEAPLKDTQALLPESSHDAFFEYRRMVNEKTSLTLLYQNNLNASDNKNHVGAILLDPMGQHDIRDACEEIGESMISLSTIEEYREDFIHLFSYFFYTRSLTEDVERARFYIRNGVLSVTKGDEHFEHYPFPSRNVQLPVLCTQTGTGSEAAREKNGARKLARVHSEGNTYIGSRDQKSFRFLGIPYAEPPARFSYPKPYSGKSRTVHATEYGPMCAQVNGGSEHCLYLNIQTPYIPRRNSMDNLRPVIFWIHGGDFTDGMGSHIVTDGGNLASREDIVVVTFNYRLSTLGFLAVPGTDIRGNYGVADQILALEWTIKNIAPFGGDPRRITIIGESAGAISVKAFLGSPATSGRFQGAIAMSSLAGGIGLGPGNDSYLSISESYQNAGERIISETGCDKRTAEQQISCLKGVPASTLVKLPTVARHIVQDGKYINTAELNLGTANVPVIFGNIADEGASFCTYPSSNIQSELEGITESLGISTTQAQHIIDSGLFPYFNTDNITLDTFNVSQRIATDLRIRCPNQASLFAGVSSGVLQPSYYYQMQRTSGGFNPNNLPGPSATPDFPTGDPDLPYFRLHASDLPWVFGNLDNDSLRDSLDLYSAQLISAYFAEFVRSGQPNPSVEYLAARGYKTTLDAVNAFDRWEPVSSPKGPIHLLDFPSGKAQFQDLEQCEFLGVPITYFLD